MVINEFSARGIISLRLEILLIVFGLKYRA